MPRECHKGLQHAPQAASHLAPKKHRPGSTTKRNRATFGEALVLSDLFFCQIHNWLQFVLLNDMWPRTMQRSAQARLSGPCKRCRTGVSRLQALAKGGRVRCRWASAEAKVGASRVQTMENFVSKTIRFMAQQL